MISGMISWKTMNSVVPRSVLAKSSYQNSYMNLWKIMNLYEFMYKFMKKTYDLGCTKKCPVNRQYIYEFIYVNTQNMNSYMNLYMNKHKMAIRVFQIWLSGCSRSERRRRLWLWRRGSGESPNQLGGLWRAKAGRAPSEWDGPRRVTGPRRLRWAAASDGGPLRLTTVTARGGPPECQA